MQKDCGQFAPTWLARTILEDKEASFHVENFITEIPRHYPGGLILFNLTTCGEYRGADRYMPTIVFLASHWTIPHRYQLLCGDTERIIVETSALEILKPPQNFLYATSIGEEAYKKDSRRSFCYS